jgi:hypothetical protein
MTSNAHKPSEKHTLDEVLKSLQDLMRGELLHDAPKPPPPPKPHYGKVGRPRKVPRPQPAAPSTNQAGDPVDVGAVLASLRSLVSHELAPEDGAETGRTLAATADTEPEETEVSGSETTQATEFYDASEALAQADSVLSELADTSTAVAAEPVPEIFETSPSATQAPVDANLSDEVTIDVPPAASLAATTVTTPEANIPEVPSPEEAQQQLPFGDIPIINAGSAAELTLEPSPAEKTTAGTVASPENETDLLESPERGSGLHQASTPTTHEVDLPEAIGEAPAIPADEAQVSMQNTATDEAEEILLEAIPPSAKESAPETMGAPTIGDQDNGAIASSPGFTDLEPPEASEESAAPEHVDEIDAQALPEPDAQREGLSESDASTDMEPVDREPESEEVPSLEIEAAEAPGYSIEFERPEPPTAVTPPEEPAVGTLGDHMEIDPGDLPVLQDVVVPPPAAAQLNLIEPPLPAADRARELAVRVAARLNIERRKRGEIGIDTKTIHRLQQLLREELEKAGAKRENMPKP